MAVLAVAFVLVGFLAEDAAPPQAEPLSLIDDLLTGLFVAELLGRLWAAPSRRTYLRGYWVDALALVPTIRGVRVLRLLRLLRLVRSFAGLFRVLASFERMARHRNLARLFLTWGSVMVISSAGLYLAESGENDKIKEPGDALSWGIVTLTTVGYGDIAPITPEGRIAAGALMLLGITLFAGITATITSFLVESPAKAAEPRPTSEAEDRIYQLIRLRDAGVLSDAESASGIARVSEQLASAGRAQGESGSRE